MRWLHPKNSTNKADLSLYLRHVTSSGNGSLEIRLWKSRKDSSIPNDGREGCTVCDYNIWSGNQNLFVLKPDEDFPWLDFMVSVIEHDQLWLESVGLLRILRVSDVWRQLYSNGGGVWDQYSVAGSTSVKKVVASMVVATTEKKMKLQGFPSCDIIAVVRERKKKRKMLTGAPGALVKDMKKEVI